MKCPGCKKESDRLTAFCSGCGLFAPLGEWFISVETFESWKEIVLSKSNTSSVPQLLEKSKISTDQNAPMAYYGDFECSYSFPLIYAESRINGNGWTQDNPYSVTITSRQAKKGTWLKVQDNSEIKEVNINACLHIPPGIESGQILQMISDDQVLYIACYIDRDEGLFPNDGCLILLLILFVFPCFIALLYNYPIVATLGIVLLGIIIYRLQKDDYL